MIKESKGTGVSNEPTEGGERNEVGVMIKESKGTIKSNGVAPKAIPIVVIENIKINNMFLFFFNIA